MKRVRGRILDVYAFLAIGYMLHSAAVALIERANTFMGESW